MAEPRISLTPERFCEEYLSALNNLGQQGGTLQSYKGAESWTMLSEKIAKEIIYNLYSNQDIHPKWRVQKEYFKVDFIGYATNWDGPDNNIERQHDWELKVAYEHENDRNKWHDELCKLCYIVADLRVLVSYHDFTKEPIKDVLQKKINRLGIWKLHRVPNSNWLFIFGPSQNYEYPFKAFTLDSNLKVIELDCCKKIEVIPKDWK
jgi:hypothetical protein